MLSVRFSLAWARRALGVAALSVITGCAGHAARTVEARKALDRHDPKKALELYNNASYVPKSLRDEAKLATIQDTLDRADRRQQTLRALADGIKAIDDAVAAGKPVGAYAAHAKLLKEHPELAAVQ